MDSVYPPVRAADLVLRPTGRRAESAAGDGVRGESRVGQAAWTAAVDHGFSILLDVAAGGRYPDGQCQCITPSDRTSSEGMMVVHYVRVYTR